MWPKTPLGEKIHSGESYIFQKERIYGMFIKRVSVDIPDVEDWKWTEYEERVASILQIEVSRGGADFLLADAFAMDFCIEQHIMKTVRIQFEIPEDRLRVLDALMEEAGMKTRTELFNNAMTLLRWAIRQRKEGRVIASIDYEDKSFREFEMPIFENIIEVESKTREVGAHVGGDS